MAAEQPFESKRLQAIITEVLSREGVIHYSNYADVFTTINISY